MKKRILLCSQWADRYRPLVDGLLDAGRFEIYCEDNFLEQIGGYHPDLKSYQPFIPAPDSLRLETEARRRITAMSRFLAEEARRSLADFDRYSFLQNDRRLASELKESLGQILYMNEAFDRIASELPLDLLIVDGPGIRQQTWVAAAKRLGVPSLEIYHATLAVKPDLMFRRQDQADYLAMGSTLIKDIYMYLGLPPERLRVTGLPSRPTGDLSKEEAVRILADRYGLNPRRRIALLFNQYDSGDAFEFLFNLSSGYQVDLIRQLSSAAKAFNAKDSRGLELLVKRHPTMAVEGWDDEEAYQYIAGQVGQKLFMVSPKESNPLLLAAADIVLIFKISSTVSEALNADRPVIMWPYCRDWLHDEILQSGSIIPVQDQKSLEEALNRSLNDTAFQEDIARKRRAYLDKFPHVTAEEAVSNLIQYIEDIIAGRGLSCESHQPRERTESDLVDVSVPSASRPTKVLHITDCLSKGGAGRGLIGVAKYSAHLGNHQHECISVKPLIDGVVSEGVTEGLKVHAAPGLDDIRRLIESADIIHWHWWEDFPLMRADLPRKPTVVWCAVSGEYPPNELTRQVVDFADIMVISTPLTRDLPAIRSLPEMERQRKVRVILESPDFERILPIERIPHDTFNIGWVGDICPGRYNKRFIDISRQINIPNVRFLICGEGPQKLAATQEAIRLGVEDRFQFLGYQEDMRRMFGLFDLYGYLLDEKTYADGELNLQEAMAAALPIVILPYGGPTRTILHNSNGLVAYSERDYQEYIEFLYRHPEESERLGNNAREYCLREFGAGNAARKFNRVYREVLEVCRRPATNVESKPIETGQKIESLKRLALFHQSRGRREKAAEHARQVLAAQPDDPDMQGMLAKIEGKSHPKSEQARAAPDAGDIERRIDTRTRESYKVTAIVSTYASEDVIRGCILDLLDQTLYQRGDLEIIIVDSASPQDEWSIIEELARDRNHILAIRTRHRESLYSAWNRAIRLARGQYLTNANADDRHRRDALEILAGTLDQHPDIAVAYGDSLITTTSNQTFESNSARRAFRWGRYYRKKLEDHCCVGPQPLWRHRLHDEIGYFDQKYVSAGDYDFWLRVSDKYPMLHVDQVLGLYLDNPQSLEHQGLTGGYERIDVLNRHHLRKLPPVPDHPLVSVIIPTFNRPHLLKHALTSLIEQTYPHWEALVISDGGDPLRLGQGGLPSDERIRIISLPKNRERSYCRNLGIREASGQYIAFLDDDDVFYRHHLELAVRTLESQGGRFKIVYNSSHRAWAKLEGEELSIERLELAYAQKFDRDLFLVRNYIPILALVFHREVFKDGEIFDEELNLLEDFDLLIRLSRKFDFYHLSLITHEFRVLSPPDANELERHKQHYLKLYDRYSADANGDWEILRKQREFVRSLDMMIFRMRPDRPACTIIIEADGGKDATLKTIHEVGRTTLYGKVEPIFLVPESDASTRELLAASPWKDKLILINGDSKQTEALLEAAERFEGELLAFLDSGCLPAKPGWLTELVEVHSSAGAGLVSGAIVDSRTKLTLRDASLALDSQRGVTTGLYAGFLFYHPATSQVRAVDAVGPGLTLISKTDFLKAGGFDPPLSKAAQWIDLCAKLRIQQGKEVIFNPFALGTYFNPDEQPNVAIESDEFDKLKARWGEDFLLRDEDWFVQDGFLSRVEGEKPGGPLGEGSYEEAMSQADRLTAAGRRWEAGLMLKPLQRIYPGDRRIAAKLRDADRRSSMPDEVSIT